ncbi:MAG TPA: Gldg family protein [Pirellulaceae bacterium]|jgi:ABC-2 type transport system permease protein
MAANFIEMLKLVAIDAIFVVILALVLTPLAQYKRAAFAVLKRNFVGYFANPTGYVFLCLFVFLTSAAAFWPHEFFVANLANLDQLNKYMPLVLLVFVPAITMSLWADERRQGTDELLLTLPAADFDIVIGKYLAAGAIFTVSLLFSEIWNYWLLVLVATEPNGHSVDIDAGLFFVTYFGYWLMGLSMLAIGMVASFLTPNLTVSFILGVLFNAIPVMTYYADVLIPASVTARQISQWSFAAQFDDFGRGVISISSIAFFVLLIVLGIYLSMVLIGKRHWLRHDASPIPVARKAQALAGLVIAIPSLIALALAPILVAEKGMVALLIGIFGTIAGLGLYWSAGAMANPPHTGSMAAHFAVRTVTLVVLLVCANMLLKRFDARYDMTRGQVSSLSTDTKKLLREIAAKQKRPVNVDAYISINLPEEYVKTRYSLVSMLKELGVQSRGKITVNLHDNLELFSEQAVQAEQRFGIQRQRMQSQSRGALKTEEFIMGVAFTCGLEKVVLPSFKLGMPVEYELVRSIVTVAGDQRKKLGVVKTDAEMMGGFSMAGMQPRPIPKQLILEDLERQYKVEEVDPTNPIEVGRYDVLLIVQPSSLGPPQLHNVVDVVTKGQASVIFEDPSPVVMPVVGTTQEKPPQGGMFGMGGGPQPKGDIRALWNSLGIQPVGDEGERRPTKGEVIWQDYNPYPKFQQEIPAELVFIRDDMKGATNAFNPEVPAVAHFEEVLFPYPAGITPQMGAKTKVTELVRTADRLSGTIDLDKLQADRVDPRQLSRDRGKPSARGYILAAWIRGEPAQGAGGADGEEKKSAEIKNTAAGGAAEEKKGGINVIYVADIDLLSSFFMQQRNEPNTAITTFRFDNVPFVCNLIDAVGGEDRFLEIRKRKPKHSTLRMVEYQASDAREKQSETIKNKEAEFERAVKKADDDRDKDVAEFKKRLEELQSKERLGEEFDRGKLRAAAMQFVMKQETAEQAAEVEKARLKRALEQQLAGITRERDRQVQQIQNEYKLKATIFPPILPLLVGLVVWARRRIREREGVSRTRMKM